MPTSSVRSVVLLAALALAGLAAPAVAQERSSEDGDRGDRTGRIYLTAGLQILDLAELNDRLDARDLPTFGESFALFGLGFERRFGAVLLGIEGTVYPDRQEATAEFDRSVHGGTVALHAGYPVQAGPGLTVYPLAGFGVGSVSFETVQQEPARFDDVLEDPGPGATLTTSDLVLTLGGGLDFQAGRRTTLGVRTGYSFSPADSDWSWDDVDVLDGPDVGAQGFFLKGMIGWGRK